MIEFGSEPGDLTKRTGFRKEKMFPGIFELNIPLKILFMTFFPNTSGSSLFAEVIMFFRFDVIFSNSLRSVSAPIATGIT